MEEVGYFDVSEYNFEKRAGAYESFVYDNVTGGGIIQGFNDTQKIIDAIKTNIDDIRAFNGKLVDTYEEFTDFNEYMQQIIQSLSKNIESVDKLTSELIQSSIQAVEAHIKEDTSLMDDLENLKSLTDSSMNDIEAHTLNNYTAPTGTTGYWV